jgi:hypothetical protein
MPFLWVNLSLDVTGILLRKARADFAPPCEAEASESVREVVGFVS